MENIITAVFLLALARGSANKDLLVIAATGCILSEAMFILINDVVLYYSIMAIISASLAASALKASQSTCNCIYAILMLTIGLLCSMLVFSFSIDFNVVVEAAIDWTGKYILTITVILAIIGSDNIITRKYYES